jgi:hypothetical protein
VMVGARWKTGTGSNTDTRTSREKYAVVPGEYSGPDHLEP